MRIIIDREMKAEKLAHPLHVDTADPQAASRSRVENADESQRLRRFPNTHAADTEVVREIVFRRQAIARLQTTVDDILLNPNFRHVCCI